MSDLQPTPAVISIFDQFSQLAHEVFVGYPSPEQRTAKRAALRTVGSALIAAGRTPNNMVFIVSRLASKGPELLDGEEMREGSPVKSKKMEFHKGDSGEIAGDELQKQLDDSVDACILNTIHRTHSVYMHTRPANPVSVPTSVMDFCFHRLGSSPSTSGRYQAIRTLASFSAAQLSPVLNLFVQKLSPIRKDTEMRAYVPYQKAVRHLHLSLSDEERAEATLDYLGRLHTKMVQVKRGVLRIEICHTVRRLFEKLLSEEEQTAWQRFCNAQERNEKEFWRVFTGIMDAVLRWSDKSAHAPFCAGCLQSMLCRAPDTLWTSTSPSYLTSVISLLASALKSKDPRTRLDAIRHARCFVRDIPRHRVDQDLEAFTGHMRHLVHPVLNPPRKHTMSKEELDAIHGFLLALARQHLVFAIRVLEEGLDNANTPTLTTVLLRSVATVGAEYRPEVRKHNYSLGSAVSGIILQHDKQQLPVLRAALQCFPAVEHTSTDRRRSVQEMVVRLLIHGDREVVANAAEAIQRHLTTEEAILPVFLQDTANLASRPSEIDGSQAISLFNNVNEILTTFVDHVKPAPSALDSISKDEFSQVRRKFEGMCIVWMVHCFGAVRAEVFRILKTLGHTVFSLITHWDADTPFLTLGEPPALQLQGTEVDGTPTLAGAEEEWAPELTPLCGRQRDLVETTMDYAWDALAGSWYRVLASPHVHMLTESPVSLLRTHLRFLCTAARMTPPPPTREDALSIPKEDLNHYSLLCYLVILLHEDPPSVTIDGIALPSDLSSVLSSKNGLSLLPDIQEAVIQALALVDQSCMPAVVRIIRRREEERPTGTGSKKRRGARSGAHPMMAGLGRTSYPDAVYQRNILAVFSAMLPRMSPHMLFSANLTIVEFVRQLLPYWVYNKVVDASTLVGCDVGQGTWIYAVRIMERYLWFLSCLREDHPASESAAPGNDTPQQNTRPGNTSVRRVVEDEITKVTEGGADGVEQFQIQALSFVSSLSNDDAEICLDALRAVHALVRLGPISNTSLVSKIMAYVNLSAASESDLQSTAEDLLTDFLRLNHHHLLDDFVNNTVPDAFASAHNVSIAQAADRIATGYLRAIDRFLELRPSTAHDQARLGTLSTLSMLHQTAPSFQQRNEALQFAVTLQRATDGRVDAGPYLLSRTDPAHLTYLYTARLYSAYIARHNPDLTVDILEFAAQLVPKLSYQSVENILTLISPWVRNCARVIRAGEEVRGRQLCDALFEITLELYRKNTFRALLATLWTDLVSSGEEDARVVDVVVPFLMERYTTAHTSNDAVLADLSRTLFIQVSRNNSLFELILERAVERLRSYDEEASGSDHAIYRWLQSRQIAPDGLRPQERSAAQLLASVALEHDLAFVSHLPPLIVNAVVLLANPYIEDSSRAHDPPAPSPRPLPATTSNSPAPSPKPGKSSPFPNSSPRSDHQSKNSNNNNNNNNTNDNYSASPTTLPSPQDDAHNLLANLFQSLAIRHAVSLKERDAAASFMLEWRDSTVGLLHDYSILRRFLCLLERHQPEIINNTAHLSLSWALATTDPRLQLAASHMFHALYAWDDSKAAYVCHRLIRLVFGAVRERSESLAVETTEQLASAVEEGRIDAAEDIVMRITRLAAGLCRSLRLPLLAAGHRLLLAVASRTEEGGWNSLGKVWGTMAAKDVVDILFAGLTLRSVSASSLAAMEAVATAVVHTGHSPSTGLLPLFVVFIYAVDIASSRTTLTPDRLTGFIESTGSSLAGVGDVLRKGLEQGVGSGRGRSISHDTIHGFMQEVISSLTDSIDPAVLSGEVGRAIAAPLIHLIRGGLSSHKIPAIHLLAAALPAMLKDTTADASPWSDLMADLGSLAVQAMYDIDSTFSRGGEAIVELLVRVIPEDHAASLSFIPAPASQNLSMRDGGFLFRDLSAEEIHRREDDARRGMLSDMASLFEEMGEGRAEELASYPDNRLAPEAEVPRVGVRHTRGESTSTGVSGSAAGGAGTSAGRGEEDRESTNSVIGEGSSTDEDDEEF